ncbi:MAG TPA: C39 family peptidase [Pantanalinema sp.]
MSNKITEPSSGAAAASAAAARLRASSTGAGKDAAAAASKPPSSTDRLNQTVKRKQLDVPLLYQYTGKAQNACGTTSLTMILQHFGKKITREEVDAKIRAMDGPTDPDEIVSFARKQGLSAAMYNKGSVDELKQFLDKGIPLEVMIDPDANPSDTTLHYVVVTGYETDPKTGKTNLLINDPACLEPQRVSQEEFEKQWSSLKVKNVGTGLDNFFVAIAPGGTELPRSRTKGAGVALTVLDGIAAGEKAGGLGKKVAEGAKSAWNTVKGWFGG